MISESSSASCRKLTVVHLTASPCFGGVERQIQELGHELRDFCRSVFVSFQEEGRCADFIDTATKGGYEAYALQYDFPRMWSTYRELLKLLRTVSADILCCHGYKANLFGLRVAKRLRIPILSVSHGWTRESRRVRMFEAVDRFVLRRIQTVVCVSEGQAEKVRRAGVPVSQVQVIRDAVRAERFASADPIFRQKLEQMFDIPPKRIVGAAGRLSPEKGFRHLVEAAKVVVDEHPDTGFVLFGDGPLRGSLLTQIEASGLTGRFFLAGFTADLDRYYPNLDLLVLPSYTEGLPNVVLEAFAAGVPVVATAVGGTPEVVEDGINGYLVKSGDAVALARRIGDLLSNDERRCHMGLRGKAKVRESFSFDSQGKHYRSLFSTLVAPPNPSSCRNDRNRIKDPVSKPTVLHLTASPCFGGVERNMLEIGHEIQNSWRSVFASFAEEGRSSDFIEAGRKRGFEMYSVRHDFPRLLATYRELLEFVQTIRADLICSHGYKANFFGLPIARRLGIPLVAVSHGWTRESLPVRAYEALGRRLLRWVDKVVCVSEGQAEKVQRAGVAADQVHVIWNAVRAERFVNAEPIYRQKLQQLFADPPKQIVGAAGRLSPEKGFKHLVDAAKAVLLKHPSTGFVLFGDGPLWAGLRKQIEANSLTGRFHLAGFTANLDQYLPHFDLLALPSYTEGLPNVVLEAFAAGVPVVATAVGGTPEAVEDGLNGYLVEPGDNDTLARRICDLLGDDAQRRQFGLRGRAVVQERFSVAAQAQSFQNLFNSLLTSSAAVK